MRPRTGFAFGFSFKRLAPELTTVANLFFFLLPKDPQYIVAYSSCGSFWFCYVGRRLQHGLMSGARPAPKIRTSKPRAAEAEHVNLTTRPWAGPRKLSLL